MAKLQIALLVLACVASAALAQQRRVVRVRQRLLPQVEEQQEQHQAVAQARADPEYSIYHAVPAQESQEYDEQPRPVLRQQVARNRAEVQRAIASPRTKEAAAAKEVVQTIRNYNTINDDGSFTFGYEAADGSFKEETRGVDCVVRGKYGYIDPDGNKREFTYVSGNPCDPNNPDPDEDDDQSEEEEDSNENVPKARPVVRPAVRPNVARVRPTAPAATATPVFQNQYQGQRIARPTPAAVSVTPRPVVQHTAGPAVTTFSPENYPVAVAPVAVTPNPIRTAKPFAPVTPSINSAGSIDFEEELSKFQQKVVATPTPAAATFTRQPVQAQSFAPASNAIPLRASPAPAPAAKAPAGAGNPYYNSQLIFNPSTGQYQTVLYQQLPKGAGEFSLNTRLQPYVHQPQIQPQLQRQPQQQQQQHQQQFYPSQPFPSLESLRAGPTQPLQAAPAGSAPSRFPANVIGAPQQSFYYINPNLRNQFSTGQIDSFLKGHNLQL
ncbi:protein PRRC2A-like [Cloeon dipterum]|uniref:protein PRRC2A-like n=1 Tax=Cloeon dipterum TaxID=197152 RepID=UPI0032202453